MNKKDNKKLKYRMTAVVLLLIYLIAGKVGLLLGFYNKSVSPFWPATGIAIAALLLLGYRFWPSILLGAFLFNFTTTPSILVSFGVAAGNTLEGLAGAYLISKYAKGKLAFTSINTTWAFFLVALIVPIISATIGVSSLILGEFASVNNPLALWLTWWIGDVIGAMLIVPLVLTIYNKAPITIKKELYLEMALAFVILISVSLILFMGWPIQISKSYHFAFLCIPILLWIAFRSCLRISIVANFLVSIIAIIGTTLNLSIFNIESVNTALIVLQLFIGVTTATTTSIAVIVVDYKKLLARLKK